MDAEVQHHHPLPDEPQRCEALQAALDLIDQGITLVDKDLKLVVWNRCFLRLFDFPPEMAYPGAPFESFVRYNALRGEYGPGDPQAQTAERVAMARSLEEYDLERTRPNGTILSVRGLALHAACSADYLSHLFHRHSGETLVGYITRLRMERALQLLASSRMAIKEVAWACGYNSPGYFIQTFRRLQGQTPSAWRQGAAGRLKPAAPD